MEGRASRDGLRASNDVRRADALEEDDARGRCDEEEAEGITRVGVRVDVRDDERGWMGLIARGVGVEGVMGGDPSPRGR